MKRILFILSFLGFALLISGPDQSTAHDPTNLLLEGDGSVKISRLPWLADQQIYLTQGWNSLQGEGTHQGQYATDWAKAGDVTFKVYVATEGDATCQWQAGGWGFRVDLDRIDNKAEWYAHLPSCPIPGSPPTHFEQGDFLSWSGNTPGTTPIHLHYEVPSGEHCLSQFCPPVYFDDVTVHRSPYHHHHPAISDNAGPGVGAPSPQNGKMRFSYIAGGHNAEDCDPGDEAWDCYGSSVTAGGVGPDAFYASSAGDGGWHQWFVSPDQVWHALNMPDACSGYPYAYVIPNQYFISWLNNASQLGQPRSQVVFTWPGIWSQTFRFGYM